MLSPLQYKNERNSSQLLRPKMLAANANAYQSQQLLTTQKIPKEYHTISPEANNTSVEEETNMTISQLLKMPASAMPGKVHDAYMRNSIETLPSMKHRMPAARSAMRPTVKSSAFLRNASLSSMDVRKIKKHVSAEEEDKLRKLIQSQYFRGLSAPDAYLK